MKLYQILENQIKKEPNYVSDNGEIKKWVVLNKAQNFDEELIGLLLEDADLKEKFFVKVKDIRVFKQNLFIQFLEQKNYLNDSYTQFKNKVGLTIDGKHLKQRNEVSLVWPFKDCILEGGQSREEDKREEIFFNETLAQDEITELLDPKVLTNAKRFDKEGEHHFDQFNRDENGTITDNLIIKGNNLLALHSLKKEFAGKVKLIYIDPPYNTGSDSFGYNDSFNQSTWLTFMKNRIESAKKLMTSSGIFLVQCSFHQYAYLKVLMNDLFEKHLCDFNIQVRHPDRVLTGDKEFNDVIEYILIYSNDGSKKMPFIEEQKTVDDYNLQIEVDAEAIIETIECGSKNVEIYQPHQYKVIQVPPSKDGLKKISIRGSIREKNSSGRFFVKHLEKLNEYPPETLFKVPDMGDDAVNYRFFYSAPQGNKNGGYYQGMPTSTDITKKQFSNFYNFEKEYNNVSKQGGIVFRNGKKPEELLKFLIQIFSDQDDIVLDYHLGSGSTIATSHKLKRQYIGIEQMQSQIDLSINRMKNVINGDITGISKDDDVNWQGDGSFIYLELKKYNQTFIDKIEEAKDEKILLQIWEEMKAKSFLNYNVDIRKQEQHIEDFRTLSLQKQKQHLCELLDKNQLYVNLSSLNDKNFECTPEEQRVTREFYQLKN
ncbi:DNA methyltransferase [Chryseobacterium arthrosphaerae]|uniref:DNA methyltransferase n=1 Tax=Chryseobacterium arthrosphaerae TaxID=651561 RepID=UPI001BAF5887|nr:site-specific DNA-methyltransferase [Chryseobacterium arthrosphaerae]QUY56730.1 site-specific DNA-methyltransferase [Chryseobacterium arthrosphaerae]UEQ76596.1 site-specific DNA-methyltransferase [Chryseobacterium arthrosphaerae]